MGGTSWGPVPAARRKFYVVVSTVLYKTLPVVARSLCTGTSVVRSSLERLELGAALWSVGRNDRSCASPASPPHTVCTGTAASQHPCYVCPLLHHRQSSNRCLVVSLARRSACAPSAGAHLLKSVGATSPSLSFLHLLPFPTFSFTIRYDVLFALKKLTGKLPV